MLTSRNAKNIYEKKVENESQEKERENITRKNLIGAIRFSRNSTFATLCQKLLFFCLAFMS